MTLEVKLYTKPECHLCHDVAAILARLRHRHPHRLVEVDITEDEELFHRYRYVIPVVEIGDQTLQAPITPLELRRALDRAG
jgi:glutaredoxin